MLGRRMTPVKGGDRHLFFGADADLWVIVKTGDEIDIERCAGGRADLVNDGPELFGWCEPHTDCSDPAASADPEGKVRSAACEGHASAGERMAAAEPLRHTRRNAAHLIRDPDGRGWTGSMVSGPEGRRRGAVRAASVSVGNDSASFSGPQAAEGNLRVSQTECPPGYATRITNMGKSP